MTGEWLWYAVLLVCLAGVGSVLAFTFPLLPLGFLAAIPHGVTLYAACMAYGVRKASACILVVAALVSAVSLLPWCVPLPESPWSDSFEQGLALVGLCWPFQLGLGVLALGVG